MAENTENTKNRLTGMLLSKSRRAQYIRLFAVLAACVVVAVAVVLHQNGVAMTHKEQVLTCPVDGVVAHTHDESCYDADGNLVCTLPELELHTHTEECYDEEGALICGLEEVTEEHVHGPGCFTTIEVEDEEPEGDVVDEPAEVAMPAQEFDDEILDDQGNLWVHVSVKAPEGAFPANTTMKIEPLDAETVRTKVEDALKKDDALVSGVKQMKAVDITFFDEQGNEIEPAVDVEVKITSDTVRDIENPVLVHVDKDESKDAEVLKKVDVVNKDEEDQTEETKDTLKFESNAFSPYVIAEPTVIKANVVTASGETYEVTVSYGEEAGIPEDVTLSVSEIVAGDESYDDYAGQTAEALDTNVEDFKYIRMFDISLVDAEGNVLEPQAPVKVEIQYVKTENEEEATEDTDELKVVHFANEGTEVIDPSSANDEGAATDTVTFTTESFSLYSIVSYGVPSGDVATGLDGKTVAIVHVNDKKQDDRFLAQAMQAATSGNDLKATSATVDATKTKDVATSGSDTVSTWTFVSAGQTGRYYIKSVDTGKYLAIKSRGSGFRKTYFYDLVDDGDGSVFEVEAGTSPYAGMVRIKGVSTSRYIRSNKSKNDTSNSNALFTTSGSSDNDHCWLALCDVKESSVYTGSKVSVQDLQDSKSYLIYKSVYNSEANTYEDYVIDGMGNLVKAYDKGDSLSMYSAYSPEWKLIVLKNSGGSPTGYYIFWNEETHKILHPTSSMLVMDMDEQPSASSTSNGVRLTGREENKYTSDIVLYDSAEVTSYGYVITDNLELTTSNEPQDFSFAEVQTDVSTDQKHPLTTVNTDDIVIHMFNYDQKSDVDNVTGSKDYAENTLQTSHVQNKLNSDGYPDYVFSGRTHNGSALFAPSNSYHKGKAANTLFLDSVYESTGYYEYSCFNNFAEYDEASKQFTVYAERGTPDLNGSSWNVQRGNFMPFNKLDISRSNNRNNYGSSGNSVALEYDNPQNGGKLYGLEGTTDWYFGMTMEFNFSMPASGQLDGEPLLYEFNGDDDLLIFVDGVLLLNIDGRHDAWPGSINFETGVITCRNQPDTTIKACFEAAQVFPDGTPWNPTKVNDYFNGNTFKDYGSHSFKMFYMEHGAYASNLFMRFNLPTNKKGDVVVEKKLDNVQQNYANVQFAYKMMVKGDNGEFAPATSAVYENKLENGNPVPVQFDNNGVFYLKPGEAAKFSDIPEEREYYVQELDVNPDLYTVYINGSSQPTAVENGVCQSTTETVKNRARVIYKNTCTDVNSNELQITKRLAQGTPATGDTFEFRVLMEDKNGELNPYYANYCIKDDDGRYYKYDGSLVDEPYMYKSGPYGTIEKIPADKTVIISGIHAGTDFYVDEIRTLPEGATQSVLIGDSEWNVKERKLENGTYDNPDITATSIYDYATGQSVEGQSALGKIKEGADAKVTFTNELRTSEIILQKKNGTNLLNGSVFEFSQWDGQAYANTITVEPGKNGLPAGTASLGKLRKGFYKLEEKTAPSGYHILVAETYFEVYGTGQVRLTDKNRNVLQNPTDNGTASIDGSTITIQNTPGDELPATGGIGTTAFYITGAALAAAGLYGLSRRRNATHMA